MSTDLVITATIVKSTDDSHVFMKIIEIIREINWKSWGELLSYTFNYRDGIIIFNIELKEDYSNNSFVDSDIKYFLYDLQCKFDMFSFQ